MFVDLLPFETNRLLVHFAAFGSLLCVAAYLASKLEAGKTLATALMRYAQAVAVAIMLFISLSTSFLISFGMTSPQQLSARATTSFSAMGTDLAMIFQSSPSDKQETLERSKEITAHQKPAS